MSRFAKSFLVIGFALAICSRPTAAQEKQPAEVVEAYKVCHEFQRLMAEDLDFDRAFEATFAKNAARRREIAITEGEFGDAYLKRVADATLISAFKSRMQIFYLMLPLTSPADKEEEAIFFPPAVKKIFDRKPAKTAQSFPAYAAQLRRDAAYFRAHLERLARKDPTVAERIRKFKQEELSSKQEPPDHPVEPLRGYSRGRVLALDEPYYRIGEYAVIRENGKMRIVGIRFFSRLF